MRKDFGKKPWLYLLPVLIVGTYDPDGTPNAMNAAWGGLYDSDQVVLCLSAGHKTTHNIEEREAFTVSFATADQMAACDYVGMVSGSDTPDKLAKTGWHVTKSSKVDAPLFDELPLTLECRYLKTNEDGNIIGEIVNVTADESILGAGGKPDAARLRPISFDPVANTYRVLGENVGRAFHDGAKLK